MGTIARGRPRCPESQWAILGKRRLGRYLRERDISLDFRRNCYIFLRLECRVFPAGLGGEIGRRNGLKIRRSERFMRVRFPPQAPHQSRVPAKLRIEIER